MEQGLQRRVQVTRVAQVDHARSWGSGTLVADADFRRMAEGDLKKRYNQSLDITVLVTQSFLYRTDGEVLLPLVWGATARL